MRQRLTPTTWGARCVRNLAETFQAQVITVQGRVKIGLCRAAAAAHDQIFEMMGLISPTVTISVFTNKIQAPDFCSLVAKLRLEGRSIRLYRTKDNHDRFLGVDEEWWHSGHSFKNLGDKDSMLSKVANPSP